MKTYKATIFFNPGKLSKEVNSISAAASWIDCNNRNYEYTSIIQEMDDKNNVLDWYYYTEGVRAVGSN